MNSKGPKLGSQDPKNRLNTDTISASSDFGLSWTSATMLFIYTENYLQTPFGSNTAAKYRLVKILPRNLFS